MGPSFHDMGTSGGSIVTKLLMLKFPRGWIRKIGKDQLPSYRCKFFDYRVEECLCKKYLICVIFFTSIWSPGQLNYLPPSKITISETHLLSRLNEFGARRQKLPKDLKRLWENNWYAWYDPANYSVCLFRRMLSILRHDSRLVGGKLIFKMENIIADLKIIDSDLSLQGFLLAF